MRSQSTPFNQSNGNSSGSTDGGDRVVRVFVSSTFRDMHDEREQLVKFVFPELRRRCREREVEFTEVDLRWGVTDEQKAEGQVLPICMAEIERCRPYFIGLLGERYGYVPDQIDPQLLETQPWLQTHQEKSITELEILKGVLNDPGMQKLSFFYFRDPAASRQVEQRLADEPGYGPEPDEAHAKLEDLKDEIRTRQDTYPAPVRENYPDAETLGEQVLDDLWQVIDRRFPQEQVPTALERERLEAEAFAAARRKVYIGGEEYFERLDQHAAGDGQPLVILGESGAGKSALLVNWAEQYRRQHPEAFVLTHYIGSSADSADHIQMLRRIMQEIDRRYSPEGPTPELEGMKLGDSDKDEIPMDPQQVIEAFPMWLAKAAAQGKFILVMDALNQLEDRDHAPDLGWLPGYIPPNVRLVVSTLPGRPLQALQKRDWPTLTVRPMGEPQRKRFIEQYLGQYRKSLNPEQTERIVTATPAANPLYLRTLLEELRVFGIHEQLDQKIGHYLDATTPENLFELVLQRLEDDYEPEQEPGLVGRTLSLIWAARRGLTETELLELLGQDGQPLPQAFWSPLYLALEESLVSRAGRLEFFHDFLRQAVEHRYVPTTDRQQAIHRRLADYFDGHPLDERKVEELPWQLQRAKLWTRLKDFITTPEMFLQLNTQAKKYEMTAYWLSIGNRFDMVEAYTKMLEVYEATNPRNKIVANAILQVADFLSLNAHYSEIEPLYRRALAIYEQALGPDHSEMATTLHNLAELHRAQGRYGEAEPLVERALAIREQVLGPNHPYLAITLHNLAMLHRDQGRYGEAEQLIERALAINEQARPDHPEMASTLHNLAELHRDQGRYGEAEPLYERALAIYELVLGPNHPYVATTLNNLAVLHQDQGRYGEALQIVVRLYGEHSPEEVSYLNNLINLYYAEGKYSEAEPLNYRLVEFIEHTHGPNSAKTAKALEKLGDTLRKGEETEVSKQVYRRALNIYEDVHGANHPETVNTMNNLAVLFYHQGEYEQAEPLFQRTLDIYEQIHGPDHPYVATALTNLADNYYSQGLYGQAEPLYERALAIYEQVLVGNHPDLVTTLNKLAINYHVQSRYEEAKPLFQHALDIYKQINGSDHPNVAIALTNLANNYYNQGLYVQAEPLYEQALAIYETQGYYEMALQMVVLLYGENSREEVSYLNSLINRYYGEGNYPEAEPLNRRLVEIMEHTHGTHSAETARALDRLGVTLRKVGKTEEAEQVYQQALGIFEKVLGTNFPDTANTLGNLAVLLYHQGEYEQADPLARRTLKIHEIIYGTNHPETAMTLNTLGSILRGKGEYEEAEAQLRRAFEILEETTEPNHPDKARVFTNLGMVLRARGTYGEAESVTRRALEIYEASDHPDTAWTLKNLGYILRVQGDEKQARELLTRSLEIYKATLGADHPDTVEVSQSLETE